MNMSINLTKGCCFSALYFYQNLNLIVQSHYLYTWEGVTNRVGSREPLLKINQRQGWGATGKDGGRGINTSSAGSQYCSRQGWASNSSTVCLLWGLKVNILSRRSKAEDKDKTYLVLSNYIIPLSKICNTVLESATYNNKLHRIDVLLLGFQIFKKDNLQYLFNFHSY